MGKLWWLQYIIFINYRKGKKVVGFKCFCNLFLVHVHGHDGRRVPGLTAEYFDNRALKGEPVKTEVIPRLDCRYSRNRTDRQLRADSEAAGRRLVPGHSDSGMPVMRMPEPTLL